jgi:hypothetical protein
LEIFLVVLGFSNTILSDDDDDCGTPKAILVVDDDVLAVNADADDAAKRAVAVTVDVKNFIFMWLCFWWVLLEYWMKWIDGYDSMLVGWG